MNVLPVCAVLAGSLALQACTESEPAVEQKRFSFHVTGDPGKPVPGAQLIMNGQAIATTDPQGVAQLALSGHEGDTFELFVQCPIEFQSPPKSTVVAVHRLEGNRLTEYAATCQPKARSIVLVVNGMKGYRLPIIQLGRTIGETEDNGVATILLHAEPNDQFEVSLDTSAPENAQLRPRNPTATFTTKNEDDVFIFDPQLSVVAKPRPVVSRHAPVKVQGPPIPIRIQ